jgi:SNF family Na+-dependent transporter
VEDIAPQIAEAITFLGAKFDLFTDRITPIIENLAMNMATHVKVMKGIEKGINKLNSVLEQTKLNRWL